MSYVVLENFRFGLDTRRSVLTSQLGTLATLENGFVNQGGEIEKRKAFVSSNLITAGSLTTFGLEALKDRLVVFGGDAPSSGVTFGSLTIDSVSYPVDYYRLWLDSTTFSFIPLVSGSPVKANGTFIFSTVFNNKPFVIASMNNGKRYAFYGGTQVAASGGVPAYYNATPIRDFFMGLALTGMTRDNFLNMLAQSLTDTGVYTGAHTNGQDTVVVTGPVGTEISGVATETGVLWNLTGSLTRLVSTPTTEAKYASGFFNITGGSSSPGTNKITSVKVDATELLQGATAIDFGATIADTVLAVVTSINNNTATSGYNARANGGQVLIYKNAAGAVAAGSGVVTVVAAGDVTVEQSCLEFAGTNFTIDYIRVNGYALPLYNAGVYSSGTDTLNSFLSQIASTITSSSTAGPASDGPFNASVVGNKLTISRKTSRCTDKPLDISVSVTPTAAADSGKVTSCGGGQLSAVITPKAIFLGTNVSGYDVGNPAEGARVLVSGGAGAPYVLRWKATLPTDAPVIAVVDEIGALTVRVLTTVAAAWVDAGQVDGRKVNSPHGQGKLEVFVTDAEGNVTSAEAILQY